VSGPIRTGGVIAVLSEVVQNQIAAGEVIERPASVVKELVENALDAGARALRVDLEEGGARLVRVADDGAGMVASDLELSFVPHATSKLREVADLDHIASLGFRGEALASMGSVARCAIFSRPAGAELGARLEVAGGRGGTVHEAGGPPGTTVEVRDLFFNTPARRRFLKKPATELARCLEVVQRAALAQVGVGFVVTHDGRRLFDVEAGMDLRQRVRRAFGAELSEALVPVEADDGLHRLHGFVAPPRFARRDGSRQMWFLNGRPLRDRLLVRCLKDAYRGFLLDGRQPVSFLHLATDPARVDVNVHPAKAEVRFRERERLFGFLVAALREAVGRSDMATPGSTLLHSALRRADAGRAPGQGALRDPGPLGRPEPPTVVREVPGRAPATPPILDAPPRPTLADAGAAVAGPVLQVARTYLVRALCDGFEIVDQHALHERVTYEELLAEVRRGRPAVQRLLVPELVELARSDLELLIEHLEPLFAAGIELEPFGATTAAVQGLPSRLRRPDAEALVAGALEVLRGAERAPGPEELLAEVLHRSACRSSVMAGDELAPDEIQALLRRAAALDCDQTCPHGRPTRVRFTLADLERAFQRK